MVLEKLGDSLKNTLQKIAKSIFVDDKLINELVKDIQRALLQADVNVQLVFDLTNKIKERIKKIDDSDDLDELEDDSRNLPVIRKELEEKKLELLKKEKENMYAMPLAGFEPASLGSLDKYVTTRPQ